jgi:hypothetical protein
VDPARRVEKLRKDYERALAVSESRGVAYHQAVLGFIESGGPNLHAFAGELGLLGQPRELDQRDEQTFITPGSRLADMPRRRRRVLARAAGTLATVVVLAALTLGALRVTHAPPFVPMTQIPRVMDMRAAAAIRLLRQAGLNVRPLLLERNLPRRLLHRVLGVSQAAGERAAKGTTITLYVAIPPKSAKKP